MIKQFFTFSYGSWVSAAISFFTTPVITLLIIPDEFGKASMFTLALNLAHQTGLLGMDQSFMRMFYEKAEKYRASLAWLCLTFSIGVTALIVCCFLPFWSRISVMLFGGPDFPAMLLLAGCLPLSVVNRFATSVVRMNKKGNVLSITQIIVALVNLAVVIGCAEYIAPTFHAILWGTVASLFLSIAISVLAERRFWGMRVEGTLFNSADLRQIFSYGLPLVPVVIIVFLFQNVDKIALRAYSSLEEIGFYAAASKFVFILTVIQSGFYLFWFPVALERYEANRTDYRFFEKMFKNMAVIVLVSAGILLLLKDVVALLFAPPYRSAVQIMPFLILAPLMHILGDVTGLGIRLKKRTTFYVAVALAGVSVNFAGNCFLVPVWGARGAAISTGVAYVIYFAIQTGISVRLFPARYPVVRFVPSFLVLILFMYLNTFYIIPWWYNIVPLLAAAFLHKRIIARMVREGFKEVRVR
jgi:O-antigen/teichoic acid export membrane protein